MKFYRSMTSASAALALGLSALFSCAEPSFAQVPSQNYTSPVQFTTYRATKTAFSPASSATDFLTIQGSATKAILLRRLSCNGVSTAAAAAILQVIKRSAADTGTQVAMTAVPLNATNAAATATVGTFAANPSLGATIGTIAVGELVTGPAASATGNPDLVFDFTNQYIWLYGVAATVALNLNAASLSAGGAVNCTVEWAEF